MAALKHTFRTDRNGFPSWLETDGNASVEMTVLDQQDSATVQLNGKVLSAWAPGLEAKLEIRISYEDLRRLVERGQEILDRHPND